LDRVAEPIVTNQPDDRSPFALAMEWSSRISAISAELIVPTLVGYWLDQRWNTHGLCLVLGVIIGFVTALSSLWRLAKSPNSKKPPR
jgi:F0F1-type ATP synthase assembly protein I